MLPSIYADMRSTMMTSSSQGLDNTTGLPTWTEKDPTFAREVGYGKEIKHILSKDETILFIESSGGNPAACAKDAKTGEILWKYLIGFPYDVTGDDRKAEFTDTRNKGTMVVSADAKMACMML